MGDVDDQHRHRLTIQECACQTTGDSNELSGDGKQLEWQHQTQMKNTDHMHPQTQLRENANHGGE